MEVTVPNPDNPDDTRWMNRALQLARQARTHPNPCVGAVLVKNGEVVGEGFHSGVGSPHAEAVAFEQAGEKARGARLYVTLEPCSFTQRPDGTPRVPCSKRCIDAGISRVVGAMVDPDARVSGQGYEQLRQAGIAVTVGACEAEARERYRGYICHRQTGLPYVLHKAAMTLDGKIATASGDSKWITGTRARTRVHQIRYESDVIVTGVGTVLADNPELTVRLYKPSAYALYPASESGAGNEYQPLVIVIDSQLRTPTSAKVVRQGTVFMRTDGQTGQILEREKALQDTGAEVITVASDANGRVDVTQAMRTLAERGKFDVLLECGGTLAESFYRTGLVQRAVFFVAPKIIGGANSLTAVHGNGLSPLMAGAVQLGPFTVGNFGGDIVLYADVLPA